MSNSVKVSVLPKHVFQFDVRDNGPKTKTLTANIYIYIYNEEDICELFNKVRVFN